MTTKTKSPSEEPEASSLLPAVIDQPDGEEYIEDTDLDIDDYAIPNLLLLQGQSVAVLENRDGAKPGVFWDPYSDSAIEPPVPALIAFFMKRRFMRQDDQHDECRSSDAIQGTRYGGCEVCVFSRWGRDVEQFPEGHASWKAPPCDLEYCFVLATGNGPATIRFKGRATQNAKLLLTQKAVARRNWWAHPCSIGVAKASGTDKAGKSVSYVIPTITWQVEITMDPKSRAFAKAMHETILQAQGAGKLKVEDAE